MQVRTITEREVWNGFLTKQHNGHLHQSYEWGELLGSLGNTVIRLGAFEQDRLVGTMMLSIAEAPTPVSLPFPSPKWIYCCRGPNIERGHEAAFRDLLAAAHVIARQENAIVLRLEPNITEEEDQQAGWSEKLRQAGFAANPFATYGRRSWVLDIRPDLSELFQHYSKKWRQNIRQAERRGVAVRLGAGEADFETFYDLLRATSIKQRFFIHPKSYYAKIFHTFVDTGDGALLIADYNRRVVGVNMIVRFGDRCWDMYSASLDKKLDLNESYLLQHHCFAWAQEQGCTHFDFRTIPEVLEPGEEMWGIYEFKKGFGGYSDLVVQTQDYIYRPMLYKTWSLMVKHRRAKRKTQHQRIVQEKKAA
jgi:peptidoglycan pentaglycine glycine transferase (the first glycine)